jgi:hypothetical protein
MRYANHGGLQGKGNPPAFRSHRLNEQDIPGLHTDNGGHEFRGGIAWPIEDESDEPVITPDRATGLVLTIRVLVIAAAVLFTIWVVQLGVPNWG